MIPLQNRLKNSKEIEYVFSHGFSAKSGFLFLKYAKTENVPTRFAITIGKNFSSLAVERNRAKRVARAEIKKILPSCKNGYDVVIFFRVPKNEKDEFEKKIGKYLQSTLKKASILT